MKKIINNIITFFLKVLIIAIMTVIIVIFLEIYKDNNREEVYIQTMSETNKIADEKAEGVDLEELREIAGPLDENSSIIEDNNRNAKEDKFYYNQLNKYGKQIYLYLLYNIDNLKLGNYTIDFGYIFNDLLNSQGGEEELGNEVNRAIQAFIYDRPQVFYIDFQKMYLQTTTYTLGSVTNYKVEICSKENDNYYAEGFTSKEQIDSCISKIEEERDDIISICNGSAYEKIKYIHDWIVDNITYDETLDKPNIHDIYGTLFKKEAVCDGYSKTFKYILDSMDIPCIVVGGTGTNSEGKAENHAWNYVKIGEVWYAIDVTWDDPIVIGGGKITSKEKYSYFLKGEKSFLRDHTIDIDMEFDMPILENENF